MNRRDFLNACSFVAAGSLFGKHALAAPQQHVLNDFYILPNQNRIPKLGLGLWRITDEQIPLAVNTALEVGYRHFDSAQAYGNEQSLGKTLRQAIADKKLTRDQLFITSKVRAEHKTFDSAQKSIEESLKKIDLDYIDLMLIHAPQPWNEFRAANYDQGNLQAWRALEEAHLAGKIKAIGVSNFLQSDLENIFAHARVKPMVNQVLLHIGNTPFELIQFCQKENVLIESYSPIAHGNLLRDERVKQMAEKYRISIAQLCIRYTLELNTISLPKSATPKHIAQNAQVDFSISAQDLDYLKSLSFKDYGQNAHFPVFSK